MFLPRPLFHINYYGNLNNSEICINERNPYDVTKTLKNPDQNDADLTHNGLKPFILGKQTWKDKKKRKSSRHVDGHSVSDQFIVRKPNNYTSDSGEPEQICPMSQNISDKNRQQSLIDAYKPSVNKRNYLNTTTQGDVYRGSTVYSLQSLLKQRIVQQLVRSAEDAVTRQESPLEQDGEENNKTKGVDLGKTVPPKHRVSIAKDPVNAQRIQLCEQAKLVARYASDKTGIPLTDIYTGRISFTEKTRMEDAKNKQNNKRDGYSAEFPDKTQKNEAEKWQITDNQVFHDNNETICTTQPKAIHEWDNRKVVIFDNDSSSPDWTMSTSGCETEEAITLEEVREYMCYYIFCCGLCID